MEIELQPFLSAPLLLGAGTGLAVGALLLFTCRLARKGAEAQHKRAMTNSIEQPPGEETLAKLALQHKLASRGSPADRLFAFWLVGATILAMVFVMAWSSGFTPAGAKEREIIALMKNTEYANHAVLSSALRNVDESLYTSRSDYLLLSNLFHRVSRAHGHE